MDPIQAIAAVRAEVERATSIHPPFADPYEAYAVLLEEVEEFQLEVFKKQADPTALRDEMVQVGAMAVRYLAEMAHAPSAPPRIEEALAIISDARMVHVGNHAALGRIRVSMNQIEADLGRYAPYSALRHVADVGTVAITWLTQHNLE